MKKTTILFFIDFDLLHIDYVRCVMRCLHLTKQKKLHIFFNWDKFLKSNPSNGGIKHVLFSKSIR